jgi:hypothetical protein
MRGLILTLVFFSIILNLSVAIMIDAVPAFNGMDTRLGMNNDATYNISYSENEVLDTFGNPVNGYPTAEDSTNINSDTLMDRVSLGMLSNLSNLLNKYMFGFVNILQALFGGTVPLFVFISLKYIIGIVYSLFLIELFTGKNILGD